MQQATRVFVASPPLSARRLYSKMSEVNPVTESLASAKIEDKIPENPSAPVADKPAEAPKPSSSAAPAGYDGTFKYLSSLSLISLITSFYLFIHQSASLG